MDEEKLLARITVSPSIFNGKPIVRGRRLAVEHVLGMLAAGFPAALVAPQLRPAMVWLQGASTPPQDRMRPAVRAPS